MKSMSNANDMAFPALDTQQTPNNSIQLGLTKRELFAALAMQGILAGPCSRDGVPAREWFDIPPQAVKLADTLLAELAK
jgi:hypothetical protein